MKSLLFLLACLLAFPALAQKKPAPPTTTPELIFPARHNAGYLLFTSDEKLLISAGAMEIKIWENQSGRLLKNIPYPKDKAGNDVSNTDLLALSPDNKTLVYQFVDTLYVYNLEAFTIEKKYKLANRWGTLVFSADGKTLYGGGRETEQYDRLFIQKIALAGGGVMPVYNYTIKTLATHEISRLSLSPDGGRLLVYDAVMGSRIIDLTTNKLIKSFEKNSFPYTYLPNGNLMAFAADKDQHLFIEELENNAWKSQRKTPVFFQSDGQIAPLEYVVAYPMNATTIALEYQGDVRMFSLSSFDVGAKFQFATAEFGMNSNKNLRIAPSGKYYVLGTNMGRYSMPVGDYLGKYGYTPLQANIQFPLLHTDGLWLQDRTLFFDKNGFQVKMFKKPADDAGYVVRLTADGKRGFVVVNGVGLFEFDPNAKDISYRKIESVTATNVVGLRLFETLGLIAVVANEGISIIDLKTYKLRIQIAKPEESADYVLLESGHNYFCDITPDKSLLLFKADGNDGGDFVFCYDLASKQQLWQQQGEWIYNIRFENEGRTATFTQQDKQKRFDAKTGKMVAVVQLPRTEWWTTIAPSGKTAAVQLNNASNSGVGPDVAIFDMLTQKQITVLKCPPERGRDVSFLRDERYLATAESGGLSIYDLQKKRSVARILLFEETDDWLVFTPDGRFDASPGAMEKMYYSRGNEIIPLESLYEQFYVPGLLNQVWEQDLPKNGADIKKLKALPTIKILFQGGKKRDNQSGVLSYDATQSTAQLQLEANATEDKIAEIRLFHNGKLVESSTRNLIVEDDAATGDQLNKTITINLLPGENQIRAVAINGQRTESLPADMVIFLPNADQTKTGGGLQLHLVVVGINTYKNPKYNLNYAQADALAFKDAIEAGAKGVFSKVNTTFVTNEQATKAGIVAALEKVKAAANPQDLFLFYYAGHGVMNDQKAFYLVPQDVTQLYGADDALAQKGLSASELQQYSKEIKAQKQLFILDACQSAGALEQLSSARGAAEEKAIAQLARSTGTHWLTASGSEQFASEFTQLGHGSFTYCLLEAFKGSGDTGDKKLTVKELDAYLQEKVPEVTAKYKGSPQYPSSYGYGQDFPIITIR